jgi:uncharacterized cofD-like protein
MAKTQKIVTIGGGTGSFVTLSGLKKYDVDLTAIVSMADDGGSTGILRDELGVLPPGDIRQCLVALSDSSDILRELFKYRFSQGGLRGHNFGNIFLSTLEKITGGFDQAVKEASEILQIKGRVLPVTLVNAKLIATLKNGKKIVGQQHIDEFDLTNLKRIYLHPVCRVNPEIGRAIKNADKIIINPGNLYSSIIPNFLVKGLSESVRRSKAKKIYIANLMTKLGHTDGFTIARFVEELEKYLGRNIFDFVIYNKEFPDRSLLKKYARAGDYFVQPGNLSFWPHTKFLAKDILSRQIIRQNKGDMIKRTLIRHDGNKLAKIIVEL